MDTATGNKSRLAMPIEQRQFIFNPANEQAKSSNNPRSRFKENPLHPQPIASMRSFRGNSQYLDITMKIDKSKND